MRQRSSQLVSFGEARPSLPNRPSNLPPTLDKHLLDYLRVLFKRRRIAIAGVVLSLTAAALHLYASQPIYESAAQILIEHEAKNTFSLQDSVAQDRETTDYYNTQFTILASRSLAKRSIESMDAWKDAELSGTTAPADLKATGMLTGAVDGLKKVFASARQLVWPAAGDERPAAAAPAPPPPSILPGSEAIETPEQAPVIDAFLSRLTIQPVKVSRMVDIKMRATDPEFAAAAANALAAAYIDQNREVRMTSSKETVDWLSGQLSEQRRRVEVAERNLQKYREDHDAGVVGDRQGMATQKLSDLNAMVTQAKADRISREALYNQLQAAQADPAVLDAQPVLLGNPQVQQLRTDLSRLQAERARLSVELLDGHPTMVALRASIADAEKKLQQEVEKRVDAVEAEYESARVLETNLTALLEGQRREATVMGRAGIDQSVLEREVQTNRQIFDSLLERTRERDIAGELKASDARVIDPAQVPRSPIWPNRNQSLLYALAFGSLIGIGLAFFTEYMDDHLRTPDELKTYLGMQFMGLVPAVRTKPADAADGDDTPLLHSSKSPLFSESFRAIRTNLLLSAADRPQSVVVTSTAPGEGKTVVSSNLALALAMAGLRVLLVDIDMRRPRLHKVFGVSKSPGLSDVLAGQATVEATIRQSWMPRLSLLASGTATDTPSELLSSPVFGQLLRSLSQSFDWVVLDSPPVAAASDACIVASRASAVLFVVGSNLTSRAAAQHAIEQLDVAGATYLGAVLNKVQLKRDSFYYATYYRPSYEKYHQTSRSKS